MIAHGAYREMVQNGHSCLHLYAEVLRAVTLGASDA
jgi:hypothetical protein